MNSHNLKMKRVKQRKGPPRDLRGILLQMFDFSQLSEKKKHFYVYSFLLLLILLAHLIRTSSTSS